MEFLAYCLPMADAKTLEKDRELKGLSPRYAKPIKVYADFRWIAP